MLVPEAHYSDMQKLASLRTSDAPPTAALFSAPEQAESHQLATLLALGQALAGPHDLKITLGHVLETLGRQHGMLRGLVLLHERETDELHIAAAHGVRADDARRVSYRVGEGITGRVAESGKPIVVPQISREPMFLDRLGVRRATLPHEELSFICVPILLHRKAVGVVGVDLPYEPARDYERTTRFLAIIAAMIAQAIKVEHLIESDKQRLLDENIHLKQELRALRFRPYRR